MCWQLDGWKMLCIIDGKIKLMTHKIINMHTYYVLT